MLQNSLNNRFEDPTEVTTQIIHEEGVHLAYYQWWLDFEITVFILIRLYLDKNNIVKMKENQNQDITNQTWNLETRTSTCMDV